MTKSIKVNRAVRQTKINTCNFCCLMIHVTEPECLLRVWNVILELALDSKILNINCYSLYINNLRSRNILSQ